MKGLLLGKRTVKETGATLLTRVPQTEMSQISNGPRRLAKLVSLTSCRRAKSSVYHGSGPGEAPWTLTRGPLNKEKEGIAG